MKRSRDALWMRLATMCPIMVSLHQVANIYDRRPRLGAVEGAQSKMKFRPTIYGGLLLLGLSACEPAPPPGPSAGYYPPSEAPAYAPTNAPGYGVPPAP